MSSPVITNIILAHRFVSPPSWYSDDYLLARNFHGLVFVLDGYAEYTLGNGKRLYAHPSDCFYMPKGSTYTTRCNDEQSFIHMTVNFDLLSPVPLFPEPFKQKIVSPRRMEQTFSALVHRWSVRHPFYQERCMGLLYELLYLFLKETQASGQPYMHKLLPARAYLDAHFTEDFPLDQLSELCGLSDAYFRRLFHRAFHETPSQYRRRLRISCAQDLLLTGHYSISEVGRLCGYPDPAYFSRMFHLTTGTSPSQYLSNQHIAKSESI